MENKRSLAQKNHEIRMDSNETNPLFGFSRFLILKNLYIFCSFLLRLLILNDRHHQQRLRAAVNVEFVSLTHFNKFF